MHDPNQTTTNDNSAYYYELFMLAKEEADYLRGKLMRVRDMAMRGTGKTDLSGIYHEADSALHGDERA